MITALLVFDLEKYIFQMRHCVVSKFFSTKFIYGSETRKYKKFFLNTFFANAYNVAVIQLSGKILRAISCYFLLEYYIILQILLLFARRHGICQVFIANQKISRKQYFEFHIIFQTIWPWTSNSLPGIPWYETAFNWAKKLLDLHIFHL